MNNDNHHKQFSVLDSIDNYPGIKDIFIMEPLDKPLADRPFYQCAEDDYKTNYRFISLKRLQNGQI